MFRPQKNWLMEYQEIVDEIMRHQRFRQLASYSHHGTSLLDHSRAVSYLSYRVCRRLGLDYTAAARGGLLHDFFLYDWRAYKRERRHPNHGLNHPRVALANALQYFSVNQKEQDIILSHMMPKYWGWPRYLESIVVSLVDKCVAVGETLGWRPSVPP